MKLTLALGPRGELNRQAALGCVATNVALPGFGSLMAGHPVGYAQAVLTLAGFTMTLGFGLVFVIWCLLNWSSLYGPEADPVDTLLQLWVRLRWALVGMGLFGFAWVWAWFTNAAILREARMAEAAAKPPKLT